MNDNRALLKAVNRHFRKHGGFGSGGRVFGIDWNTWVAIYPQIAYEFSKAAQALTGRPGRYLPRFN